MTEPHFVSTALAPKTLGGGYPWNNPAWTGQYQQDTAKQSPLWLLGQWQGGAC